MITFTQIRNFLMLAKELHFARSAEKLGISQAALSSDIRKLETDIQNQLFDRSDKWDIRLTAAGKVFCEHVRDIPEKIEKAKSAAYQASRGEHGTLSVRVLPSVYNHINLVSIFRQMTTRYPDVKLTVSDSPSEPAATALQESSCDIAFMVLNSHIKSMPGLKYRRLFSTPLAFVIPKTHFLASKKDLTLSDFKDCGFIMPSQNEMPWFKDGIEETFINQGKFVPKVVQEARGPLSTMNLAAAGFGIGILAENIKNEFPDFLVFRRIPAKTERIIIAAWMENNKSPVLKNFIGLLNGLQFHKNR